MILRLVPIVPVIAAGLQAALPDSASGLPPGPFLSTPRIFHHPAPVLFVNRPYDIDLFVDFPADSLESVSLFYRTDSMPRFQEVTLPIQRARYRYRFDPNRQPATELSYFFVVTLQDFSLYATPLDEEGRPLPITRRLRDPVQYYRRKLSGQR